MKLARHYVALEKDADPRSVQAIQARVILAKTLGPRRSLDERRQLLNEAEEIALQTLGPTHAATLTVEQSMAQVLMESGQYAAAEARLRELLRIRRSGPDPENQFLLGTKLELGTLLARTGRPSEGERLIREAYAVQIRVLGAAHPATITSIQSLAECKLAQGECSAARQLVAELIDFLLDSYPADEYRVFEARGIQQFIENGIAD